jgi:hypothetical protein
MDESTLLFFSLKGIFEFRENLGLTRVEIVSKLVPVYLIISMFGSFAKFVIKLINPPKKMEKKQRRN